MDCRRPSRPLLLNSHARRPRWGRRYAPWTKPASPPRRARCSQQPHAVEMTTPMAASLLHFASVLSRMPPLPESTSALPARGTLQRDHLEQAINWCFMQIKLL